MSVLKFLLKLSLILVALQAGAKEELSYQQLKKNLQNYQNKIEVIQSNIDRSIFDDQEILILQDFDAEKIIKFVKQKIAFQPYMGLLRGVRGTLNSRAGNSLDQSILLAKMLKDAGYEARIIKGLLSNEQSLQLLKGMAAGRIPENIGNGADFDAALAKLEKSQVAETKPSNWKNSHTFQRYQKALVQLQKVLQYHHLNLEDLDITKQLIQQNKEYYWVEYRMDVTQDWMQAQPAMVNDGFPNLKKQLTLKDEIPKEYLHQIKIEAFIQQRVGSDYKTLSLMKPWVRPAANLQDMYISYANMPSSVDIKSQFNLDKILNKSQFFIPVFNGQAVGGKAFDLQGRLIDIEAMSSPAAGIFKAVGDKTLSAVDALEGNDKSKLQLAAMWLQFTFISPEGKQSISKRYIYQSDKDKVEDSISVKMKLLSRYELLVNTGEQPLAYLADLYLNSVKSSLPWLQASTQKLFSGEKKAAFPKKIPESAFDLITQYQWMNHMPGVDDSTLVFRAEPNLLGFKRGYLDSQTGFYAVDIINNTKSFIKQKDQEFFSNRRQSFQQGVWDTACEWLPSRLKKIQGIKLDTLEVANAAETQKIPMRLLKPESGFEEKIESVFEKETMAYQRVAEDMNKGYWVVIPQSRPEDLRMSGWWRINPQTGESLGMTADGGGQEITEYEIEMAQIALMLARSLGNLQKCDMDSSLNNFEKMCCMAEAHLNNVVGLSFGGALAKNVGTAGAAVFDIVDFTHELGTGTGIAPGTNGAICDAVGPIPDF